MAPYIILLLGHNKTNGNPKIWGDGVSFIPPILPPTVGGEHNTNMMGRYFGIHVKNHRIFQRFLPPGPDAT